MEAKQETCAQRIRSNWSGRRADLRLFAKYGFNDDIEEMTKKDRRKVETDCGEFSSYGLCFDYVRQGTFKGQNRGYYRYQFSWGGPSDELRFYRSGRAYYHFMDWFDGAKMDVTRCAAVQALAQMLEDVGAIDWEWANDAD